MRLDLFLKLSRLCPRRAIAQQLCDARLVLLNGRAAKPAHAVNESDTITVRYRHRETTVRVKSVPAGRNVSRQAAHDMVDVLAERHLTDVI